MKISRLAALGLAALALAGAGTAVWQKAFRHEPLWDSAPTSAAPAQSGPGARALGREAMERALAGKLESAPEYAAFFERVKTVFPSDYETFLASLSERAAGEGDIGSADFVMAEAMRALRLSRGALAAKAGKEALEHFFDVQLAMLQALGAEDPNLCVNFLYGSGSTELLAFSAANRSLVTAQALAAADAISDGQLKKMEREPPTEEDFDFLEKVLRAKGLDKTEIEALLDGRIQSPAAAAERMCRAGQIYLETIAAMPEDSRLRIYSLALELMARS
ncbi:MAG TPA: hypothetical protein VFF88_00250 [Methylocella sp.]|nr:hypothetical protein [Methylocella sp.]